jgi:hypothetical protein
MTFSNAIFRSFQNSKEDQATPLGSSFGLVMASLRRAKNSNSHEPSQKISKPCVTAMQTLSKTRQLQIQKIFEFSLHQRLDDFRLRSLPSKKFDVFK